jgi:phosphatidylserine synthase
MVSSVPFPSFKEFHWRSRGTVGVLFLGLLFLVLILIRPEVTLFAFGALYIVLSLTWNILVKFRIFSPPEAAITAPGEVHER